MCATGLAIYFFWGIRNSKAQPVSEFSGYGTLPSGPSYDRRSPSLVMKPSTVSDSYDN